MSRQRRARSSLPFWDAEMELARRNKFANWYQAHRSAADGKQFERMIHLRAGFDLPNAQSGRLFVFTKITILQIVTFYFSENGIKTALKFSRMVQRKNIP